jgi:hypothetical protein
MGETHLEVFLLGDVDQVKDDMLVVGRVVEAADIGRNEVGGQVHKMIRCRYFGDVNLDCF